MSSNDFKNEDELAKEIIRVIIFFDLFDYPLTAYEIWKYLDKKPKLTEIIKFLDNAKMISSRDGFFFLPGREENLLARRKKHNYTLRKIKIAWRFARLFSFFPFVKTVILSNSLGQYNLRDGSDIDFFIITSAKRVWLTRLFCASVAKILNRRPTTRNKRDKICLSFYLSAEDLDLGSLKLDGDDPYFFYWQRSFILLYNKDEMYERFLAANNLLPETDFLKRLFLEKNNSTLNTFEKIAKKIQLIIMSPDLKRAINNSDGVVVNDKVLKLYLHDNRREYAEKYGNRLKQIFAENN